LGHLLRICCAKRVLSFTFAVLLHFPAEIDSDRNRFTTITGKQTGSAVSVTAARANLHSRWRCDCYLFNTEIVRVLNTAV